MTAIFKWHWTAGIMLPVIEVSQTLQLYNSYSLHKQGMWLYSIMSRANI